MVFRSNNKLPIKGAYKKYVFLAGSIDNKLSSNWRKQVGVKWDSNNYIDPINDEHDDLNTKKMKAHIE